MSRVSWIAVWAASIGMFACLALVERYPIPSVIAFAILACLVCINVALADRPGRA